MKSPDIKGDYSPLSFASPNLFSKRVSEHDCPDSEKLQILLNQMSDHFQVDMTVYKKNLILSAAQERMQANRLVSWNDYISIISDRGTEATALYRQIVSSPEWGLQLIAAEKLVDLASLLVQKTDWEQSLRIWVSRCGLGYNVINLVLALEDQIQLKYGESKLKPNYKIFATDIDYQLVKTANKLAVPDLYRDVLHRGSSFENLIEDSGSLLRLRSQKRNCINFAVHNHLQNHSLANMDLFIASGLAEKLDNSGRLMLVKNIAKSLNPGAMLLCDEPSLAEILDRRSDFMRIQDQVFARIDDQQVGKKNRPSCCIGKNYVSKRFMSEQGRPDEDFTASTVYKAQRFLVRQALNPAIEATARSYSEFESTQQEDLNALVQSKNEYIDLLHLEIDELYDQIQDMTEELSTSLEELETVNEELRISNDQLATVNDQYSHKLEELSFYLKDYDEITSALNLALVFVDQNRKIRFFNSRAENLLGLCSKDLNRSFTDFIFASKLQFDKLYNEASDSQKSCSLTVSYKGISQRFIKAIAFTIHQVNCEGVLFCIGDSEGICF